MSPEILTIIGMTATVLIATWTMNRSLCSELWGDIKDVRSEIKNLREAQHGLNERMAGVEGLVTSL